MVEKYDGQKGAYPGMVLTKELPNGLIIRYVVLSVFYGQVTVNYSDSQGNTYLTIVTRQQLYGMNLEVYPE